MATGYDDIDNLQNQTNQLYEDQMKQQENMINASTQQTIAEIERNKQKAQQEADKTNRALYTDYQKQVNPYGVNAENLAEQGLAKSGLAETTKANYYNTYQSARTEAMNNANMIKADFDAEIARARQNGDLQTAQAKLDLYKQRMSDLANMYNLKFQADQFDYQKQQDALNQSNWEKEFQQAQQQAQWEQAFNQSQFDYQKDRDVISDNQFNQQFNYQKDRDTVADNQWNQQFAFNQDQFGYQKEQDALSQSNWEKEYEQALKEMLWNQQFNQSQFDYQKEQDKLAQSNWEKEFALAKKKSTASSGGGNNPKNTLLSDYGSEFLQLAQDGLAKWDEGTFGYKESMRHITNNLNTFYNEGKLTEADVRLISEKLGI